MTRRVGISVILAGLLFVVCPVGTWVEVHAQISAGQKLNAEGEAALQRIIDSAQNPELRWPDFHPYQTEVKDFYTRSGSTLGWVRDRQPTPQALAMIALFTDSDHIGLVPEDYDASRWPLRLQKLQVSPSDTDLADFDAVMTVSTMRFIRALHVGRVNPKTLGRQLDVDKRKYELGEFIYDKLINANDPAEVVKSVEPTFPGYLRTLDALHRYREFAKVDTGKTLAVPAKPIVAGGTYPDLPRLTQLMRLVGDLPADAQVDPSSIAYQGAIVEAVKSYQVRHGEIADGHLKAELIKELNVPMEQRVRQVELALERWRWLEHSFAQPPVLVNLPEFRLLDRRCHFPVWPEHHIFDLEKDRNYIAKKNFEVVTPEGKVVTDGVISDEVLAKLKSGKLHVRQKPGPTNSLGLVKLIFPNEDNVYLHGTEAPQLFSEEERDLSHGCIHVQKPADLAAWALRHNPGWNLERVQAAMNGTDDNVTVILEKPIPVLILYGTVVVDEKNVVFFFDDVYGYDKQLDEALKKGYPYPTA